LNPLLRAFRERGQGECGALLAALGTDREPPMHFELRFALGRVYLATGRLDRATRELHRALKLRPGDEETLTMLAVVLRQQNQEAEALQTLREAAVLEGLQRAASWALLGQLEAGQNLDAAKRAFGRALALDPNQREALEGAASCALEQGQVEEAHGCLKRLRASGGSARFFGGSARDG
jgi:tetratricopeptide (TPR) repeat protein